MRIDEKDNPKYHQTQNWENYIQDLAGQGILHSCMITHPLEEVAHELCVEERHGELEELDEEVTDQWYVYTHWYVQ